MYEFGRIKAYKKEEGTTEFVVHFEKDLAYIVEDKKIRDIECRFDDGRHISNDQRKKAYATIRDIAAFTGYLPEEAKEMLKYKFVEDTGGDYLSLSDCTMDQAREFITFLLKFALENDIPMSDAGVNRAEDISSYLYYCIKTRHCSICGASHADIHHCEGSRIGMDGNRNKVDHSKRSLICLCRKHHDLLHTQSEEEFLKKYHIYGLVIKDFKEET